MLSSLRPASPSDTARLLSIAVSTGLFQPADAEGLLGGILQSLHAGALGAGHTATVWVGTSNDPQGWVYFAPDQHAEGVWNLWWIGVTADRHGQGVGAQLLAHVASQVAAAGGRLLVIETSSLPATDRARRFYEKQGYRECGRVPDFYGDGDDKVIFSKRTALGDH